MDILLWILLVFVITYYALKLFLRYGLPWLIARFVKKQQEKFNQQPYQQQQKEGEVHIRKEPENDKHAKDDKSFGEYVEFEDVDDK